jgi:phospholipase A-2-activating protein
MWKLLSSGPPSFDETISSHGHAFINSLTYIPPTTEYPEGLIVSGGKDTIIEVRQPSRAPEDNAEALLLGHSNNVCALDIDPSGKLIVSGGWDGQARVWGVGKWECDGLLEGHEGSVWAVLAWSQEIIITGKSGVRRSPATILTTLLILGSADKLIRIFSPSGKLIRTIRGNTDVVRALCRLPPNHASSAHFASAGNDGLIRLWTLEGRQVSQLIGHENFIYSLACSPTGEIVSSGEDRTVRIWKDNRCIQTITHPAISVWSVAVCAENGDIVSGSSDRIVRVFSRDQTRQAEEDVLKKFEESVQSSAIPQQQVGDINKDQLPGPEFLQQKSGTKEGQVIMIKEHNGAVTAHQWSTSASTWINVGTVVDAVGSSGRKREHQGKEYDYVFDVDIEDGKPPLKLPYNLSQDPYEAATKFIQDNELPISYLEQVAAFITSNTQGATIGTSQQQETMPDAWGTENRYRPGEGNSPAVAMPSKRPNVLPQKIYLSIKQANLRTIQKKIEDLNMELIASNEKDISLNPADVSVLQALVAILEKPPPAGGKTPATIIHGIELVIRLTTLWPTAQRLPGLDLLRLLAAATPVIATYRNSRGESILEILEGSAIFEDKEKSNNIMLAVRMLVNLFETEEGRKLAAEKFDKVSQATRRGCPCRNIYAMAGC